MSKDKLFKNTAGEELDYLEPDKTNEILESEGLIDLSEDKNGNAVIQEESLDFLEPVKPDYVVEEVLFKDETEEISFFEDLSIVNDSVLNDDVTSELLATNETENDVKDDDLQINFGDLGDLTEELFSDTNKFIKKPFAVKMFEAEPIILERYNELKNYILSFKKIKSRISNTADTFNIGRDQLFKLSTSGKSLKLYLNLDVTKLESKFNIIDAGDTKSYEQVPAFLRIRSNRAMKYAYVLIDRVISKFDLAKNPKYVKQDYVKTLKEIANNKKTLL